LEKTLLFIFFILVVSVPFLYRFIRIGRIGWFVNSSSNLINDKNYNTAEKLRTIQVFLGATFFIIHGAFFWGFFNTIFFLIVTIIVSLLFEIIGSKTGYFFGGKYHYNKDNTPGYIIFGIPVLIPIAWFGIIYMGINFCSYVTNIRLPIENSVNYFSIILTAIFVMLLDLVLDPLAVDEKRWSWESPGIYYGVPILNFFGWLLVPTLILLIFQYFSYPVITTVSSFSVLFQYSPGILFIFLPMVASRPCFERGLVIPGLIGIITSFIYFVIVISRY
tara:strand:- start:104 stop:931 length:828 start_codon:yes stop_codon:yes gene_type:complete